MNVKNVQTLILDGVSFQLKESHDFKWLHNLGEVFCVFDQQDSGNISFGVQKGNVKRFVKYGGAQTLNYSGEPREAVNKLKKAKNVYKELEHAYLVKLVGHLELPAGFALVFEWFDGLNIQKNSEPSSAYQRFKKLPLDLRLQSLTTIFEFHAHVERNNYVALDFYDGSILYDFEQHITKVCDVDLYHIKPFYNQMGRLWGSSRFMSPEEFSLASEIDGQSNVFNMGAIAFALVGGTLDRSYSNWEAGEELYQVAKKAVEKDRNSRYASLFDFYTEWKFCVGKTIHSLHKRDNYNTNCFDSK